MNKEDQSFIFGKNDTTHIVSCEVLDGYVELFREIDGVVTSEFYDNKYWLLSNTPFNSDWERLKGNLHYKYIKYYNTKQELYIDKRKYRDRDVFGVSDTKEQSMLLNGFTYFKGMKVDQVSSLFFDIESTGLVHNKDSKVLLISNTFVKNGVTTRKLFAYDEYETESAMLDDWCKYVRECNPSNIVGHNVMSFDLPYLDFCSGKAGTSLKLGRDGSDIRFDNWESKFRKDASQDILYKRPHIYGREIIDTFFLAIHFDFARTYESYALKQIIKQEGLEVKDRVFYDAGKIWENYEDPVEWEKIKQYANHDADDAKSLYYLMAASYFYLAQSVPKSFQAINYTATGSQVNAFLIRSYLQEGHSVPKACEPIKFPGAISRGTPGIFYNCWKFDATSLYPSIIRQYEIYDKHKDPKGNFLKMVDFFTLQRLEDKKKAKETGDRYYKELEQSRKIFVNSSYGLLGSVGLLFNSPTNAALVTKYGRDVLKKAILWSSSEIFEEIEDDKL